MGAQRVAGAAAAVQCGDEGLGILEVACTVIYLIPRTAVLGAILLTGYLGGATATHVRIGEPWFMPVLLGVVVWLGIYLRDPRLRALIPLRRSPQEMNSPHA